MSSKQRDEKFAFALPVRNMNGRDLERLLTDAVDCVLMDTPDEKLSEMKKEKLLERRTRDFFVYLVASSEQYVGADLVDEIWTRMGFDHLTQAVLGRSAYQKKREG